MCISGYIYTKLSNLNNQNPNLVISDKFNKLILTLLLLIFVELSLSKVNK